VLQALDPTNKRHEWHYNRRDSEDASKLIERNGTRDVHYNEQVSMHRGDVEAYFTKGYLRSDAPATTKHTPKHHAVGRMPGTQPRRTLRLTLARPPTSFSALHSVPTPH
jgi:hypothetical protein